MDQKNLTRPLWGVRVEVEVSIGNCGLGQRVVVLCLLQAGVEVDAKGNERTDRSERGDVKG